MMHRNTLVFVIVAAIGGFIAGFWLANSLNRSAISGPITQNAKPAGNTTDIAQKQDEDDLSPDELRAKIAEADKNPTNFGYQKDLGTALYRYASIKQDLTLFTQAVRILERANSINGKDFDVLVALGNAHFDIGFFKEDAASFQKARDVYTKALEIKPGDPDVSTDFGITYYLQKPPAYDKAVAELTKVSTANPRHERSLQFLIQTYIKQNKLTDAEKTLAKLKSMNPDNTSIADLTSQLTAAQNGVSK